MTTAFPSFLSHKTMKDLDKEYCKKLSDLGTHFELMNEWDLAVGALMCQPAPLSGRKDPHQLLGMLPTGRPQRLKLLQVGRVT